MPEYPTRFHWKQVDGDINPETYGCTLARIDGTAIELRKIQPVLDCVGERDGKDVGFPFWTREAYFDPDDLEICPTGCPESKVMADRCDDCNARVSCIGCDHDEWRQLAPEHRACAYLDYVYGDEGPAGFSRDVLPVTSSRIKWYAGKLGHAFRTADAEYRRVLRSES